MSNRKKQSYDNLIFSILILDYLNNIAKTVL